MIYVVEADFAHLNISLEEWMPLLNPQRQEKAMQYRFYKDRALCVFSWLLLRFSLKKEYGVTEMPEFEYSEYGKPKLSGSEIRFNLSHCDTAVACGVDRKEIGVDVQDFSPLLHGVTGRFLTQREKEEAESIRKEELKCKELARMWSLKEAYGKYLGVGLQYPAERTDFSGIRCDGRWQEAEDLRVMSRRFQHCALAVCSENEMVCRKIRLEEILG